LKDVVILSAARTPIGKFNGALGPVPAPTLGITAAKAAIARARLDPKDIEEVFMGQVLTAGVGQAPARQVALGVGCPPETEATTINKVCASGMKAVIFATQSLQLGTRQVMLAGGMEKYSTRSPLPRRFYLCLIFSSMEADGGVACRRFRFIFLGIRGMDMSM